MRIAYVFIILITSLATASFTVAFVIFNATIFRQPVVQVQQVPTNPTAIPAQQVLTHALREELAKINSRLSGVEKRISSINEEIELLFHDIEKLNQSGNQDTAKNNGSTKPKPAKRSRHSRIPSKRTASRRAYLSRQFKEENRDPKWSSKAMVTLMKTLSDDMLRKSELAVVDCRSTFCMVRVNHTDRRIGESFIKRFGTALDWIQSRIEVFFVGENEKTTELYIFKSDKF